MKSVNETVQQTAAVSPPTAARSRVPGAPEHLSEFFSEYAEAIGRDTQTTSGIRILGRANVEVRAGRKYATVWAGYEGYDHLGPHSVIDMGTGEVYVSDPNGKPVRALGPMYNLNDPEDRALLMQRASTNRLSKRPWKERVEYAKKNPPKPAEPKPARKKREPGTPPSTKMSAGAVKYLRDLGARGELSLSMPKSDSWVEGWCIPSATARGLVDRGYAYHPTRINLRYGGQEEYVDKKSIRLTDAGRAWLEENPG